MSNEMVDWLAENEREKERVKLMNSNVIDLVMRINCDIEDIATDIPEDYYMRVEYFTDGFSESIEFMGIPIWGSEFEEREYGEDGEYEPLETYVKNQINKILVTSSLLRLKLRSAWEI